MATYWENSCSFGLRCVSWYKYLIVSLVFSHLGFWSGHLFLIAPFPDICLLVPFSPLQKPRREKTKLTIRHLYHDIVSRMSSYFPNRWPLSYLNLIKSMKTYIRRQQHKKFKTPRHKTKRTTTEVSPWNDQ